MLDTAFVVVREVGTAARKSPSYGFTDTFDIFIKKMLLLNPQSYGSRIQNYIADQYGLTLVKQTTDKGDFVNSMGQHYEIKVSLVTDSNPRLNLVQIRPWQIISGYYFVAIDTRRNPFKVYVFMLSKNEMAIECAKHASSAHGTKTAVAGNANKELRMDVPIREGNDLFEEWRSRYLQPDIRLGPRVAASVTSATSVTAAVTPAAASGTTASPGGTPSNPGPASR
jgi:hypothetical protein